MASIERKGIEIGARQSEILLKGSALSYIAIGIVLLTVKGAEPVGIGISGIGLAKLGLIEKLKRNDSRI